MYVSSPHGEVSNTIADSLPGQTALPATGAAPLASAGPDVVAATVTTLNAELLLADDPAASTGEETPTVVPIPVLTSVAIGICLAVTVVFGVIPAPLLDFANHATLLFLGH
jgi:hypothetical protein